MDFGILELWKWRNRRPYTRHLSHTFPCFRFFLYARPLLFFCKLVYYGFQFFIFFLGLIISILIFVYGFQGWIDCKSWVLFIFLFCEETWLFLSESRVLLIQFFCFFLRNFSWKDFVKGSSKVKNLVLWASLVFFFFCWDSVSVMLLLFE